MSTRIYQGFRLKTDSFAEALRLVESFRPWVTEQAEGLMDTFLANQVANGRDSAEAYDTWRSLRDRIRKEGSRVPLVDTDFSISLIPAGGQLLGIVYTERYAWFEAWTALPEVEEFGYWNNTDEPDGMSEEEWAAREKAWSVLSSDPVSMQSFSIELVSPNGPMPKAWRQN